MLVSVQDSDGTSIPQLGIGPKLKDTPGSIRSLGVTSGYHTDQVLRELGYGQSEISKRRGEGTVG